MSLISRPSIKFGLWVAALGIAVLLPLGLIILLSTLQRAYLVLSTVSEWTAFGNFLLSGIFGVWGGFTITVFLFQRIVFQKNFWDIGFNRDIDQFIWGILIGTVAVLCMAAVLWVEAPGITDKEKECVKEQLKKTY
jgi:hypothetical protein